MQPLFNHFRRVSRPCLVLVLLATALLECASALAASAAVAPPLAPLDPGPNGYFEYTLSPGASAKATVAIGQLGSAPARYILYVAQAVTSPVGGVAYGQPAARQQGAAAWLSPTAQSISPSRERRLVRFRVTVPLGTAPGDYVAAIAAQPPAPVRTTHLASGDRSVGFVVTARTIVAVVIHVSGKATAAARLGQPRIWLQQRRRQVLSIPIDDTGAILMRPYLAGQLQRCGGQRVLSMRRQLDTFVPHTRVAYPWYLNDQTLRAGCYRVTLGLYRRRGGPQLAAFSGVLQVGRASTRIERGAPEQSRPYPTTSLPPWLLAATVVVAALILLTSVSLLRGRAERRRLLERLARASAQDPGMDERLAHSLRDPEVDR